MTGKHGSLAERFWSKVEKTDSCWNWTGSKDTRGYGLIGMKENRKWTGWVKAHRVVWELTYGPIPKDSLVCHHCDNSSCVRPDHLFLGSKGDNSKDAVAKGRWNPCRGENNYNHKLTLSQVREIRNIGNYMSQRKLAAKFGVARRTIRNVLSNISWKGVK